MTGNHKKRDKRGNNDKSAGNDTVRAKPASPVVLMAQNGRHAAGAPAAAASDRRAEGKALRDTAPRESHAGWKAPTNRARPDRPAGRIE